MGDRFYVHQWGKDAFMWSVCEALPGKLPEDEPYAVLSWLTERQAQAIADALNNMAGHEWHKNHPDWFAEAKTLGSIVSNA